MNILVTWKLIVLWRTRSHAAFVLVVASGLRVLVDGDGREVVLKHSHSHLKVYFAMLLYIIYIDMFVNDLYVFVKRCTECEDVNE